MRDTRSKLPSSIDQGKYLFRANHESHSGRLAVCLQPAGTGAVDATEDFDAVVEDAELAA